MAIFATIDLEATESARRVLEIVDSLSAGSGELELAVAPLVGAELARNGAVPALREQLAGSSHLPTAVALYSQVLQSQALRTVPSLRATRNLLELLVALTPVRNVSLWRNRGFDRVESIVPGEQETAGTAEEETARRLILDAPQQEMPEAGPWVVPVRHERVTPLALLVDAEPEDRELALALAEETAEALACLAPEVTHVSPARTCDESLPEWERRFSRFVADLHDGPIQDVVAVAGDVRFFRTQLQAELAAGPASQRLLGRVDDLEARLAHLEDGLRAIALNRPLTHENQIEDYFRRVLEEFCAEGPRSFEFHVSGAFTDLTDSQRIVLRRVLEEALSNIERHSDATEIRVSLQREAGEIELVIVDNGRGFEVESTLLEAGRRGRLGVVGMNERVKALGGSFRVESSPGGPTEIEVSLPEWRAQAG